MDPPSVHSFCKLVHMMVLLLLVVSFQPFDHTLVSVVVVMKVVSMLVVFSLGCGVALWVLPCDLLFLLSQSMVFHFLLAVAMLLSNT